MDELLTILAYNEDSPSGLVYKVNRGKRTKAGDTAGTLRKDGYWQIAIKGKMYQAARVVWTLCYGQIPEGFDVDHEDVVPSNNRKENLRLATKGENNRNRLRQNNNQSGVKGLCWSEKQQRWQARVKHHGINHTIFTKNREYAEAWLIVKRAELHGDFANNGVRPHEGE